MDSDTETDFSHTWISLKSLKNAADVTQLYRNSVENHRFSDSLSPERGISGKIGETHCFARIHSQYTNEKKGKGPRRDGSCGGRSGGREGLHGNTGKSRGGSEDREEIRKNTLKVYSARKEKREKELLTAKISVLQRHISEQQQYIAHLERFFPKSPETPPLPPHLSSSLSTKPPLSTANSPEKPVFPLLALQELDQNLESLQIDRIQTENRRKTILKTEKPRKSTLKQT